MGFIADMAKADPSPQGRALWDRIFGTDKETPSTPARPTSDGGSYGNSIASDASMKRFVEALRSLAPGMWTDDRYAQSKAFTGIQYISIHRMSEQLAQSEFKVSIRDDNHVDGKRPVKKGESAYALIKLLENPNNQDCFGDMMYRISQQMGLTGTGLVFMMPNQLGEPIQLYSIPTAVAVPQPVVNPEYPEGYYRIQPLYPYGPFSSYPTPSTSVGAPVPAQWMLRILYPHPLLRYDAWSPTTALNLHIDEVTSIDRSRAYKMLRSVSPEAVLNFTEMEGMQPLPEPEINRIKREFQNAQGGPTNAGNLFVATPGAKLEPWGAPPKDMEYKDGWSQLVSFIMAGFGTTKPVAGMVEDSSYSTLFASLKQVHLLTLQPQCNRIAAQFTKRLAPFYGEGVIIEIRCPRIDDHEVVNGQMNVLISGKAITKGELRRKMGLPPWGDERDDEIAGAEDQQQQEQAGMSGIPGAAGEETSQQPSEEPEEVTSSRPTTGTLGLGALGPRKNLKNGFHANGKVHRR